MSLNLLKEAYISHYGNPDYLLRLESSSADIQPEVLETAFLFPIEEEDLFVTTLTTLGLSLVNKNNYDKPIELVIDVLGKLSSSDCDLLGNAVANLIWQVSLAKDGFRENCLFRNIDIPIFQLMSDTLVIDRGYGNPEFIENTNPPVRLLEIVPIHTDEANALEAIYPPELRMISLIRAVKDRTDPNRESVDIVLQVIIDIWTRLESWYERESSRMYARMMEGASEEDIRNLEETISLSLPDDFVNSLKQHNGNHEFYDAYEYLSTEKIHELWSMMNQLKNEGRFNDFEIDPQGINIIQNTWWDSRWIPFAADSGGNLICIDLNPEINGIHGQIIYHERSQGPLVSPCQSFLEWLWLYSQNLISGKYEVDNSGFIHT